MIKSTVRHVCYGCGRSASRQVLDRPTPDGARWKMWLCLLCPSPQEIDQRSAVVRAGWSDDTYIQKYHECRADGVAYYSEYHLDDHIAHAGCLTGRVCRAESDD